MSVQVNVDSLIRSPPQRRHWHPSPECLPCKQTDSRRVFGPALQETALTSRTLAPLATLLLVVALAGGGTPAVAQTKTLKLVTDGELKILDPTFTTA